MRFNPPIKAKPAPTQYEDRDESDEAEIQRRTVLVLHKLSLKLCIVKLAQFLTDAAHVGPTLEAATTCRARNTRTGVLRLVLRAKKVCILAVCVCVCVCVCAKTVPIWAWVGSGLRLGLGGCIFFRQTRHNADDVTDFYYTQLSA